MANPPRSKHLSILLQVLVWSLLGFFLFLYSPFGWNVPPQFWIKQLTTFILLIVIYYLNAMVLVPRLLFTNRNKLFFLSVLVLSVLFMLVMHLSGRWLELPELMKKTLKVNGRPMPPVGQRVFFHPFALMMPLFVLGISTTITSIQKWQKDNQLRVLLEQENITSELAYLKSQINPHFFFNTLNNIYALMHVDIESSKKALHKLSRMMRYLLYETQNEHTLLSKELAFVTDFIDLMKLRLLNNAEVIYKEPKLSEDFTVNPMLFLPLIENAFKHGIHPVENSYVGITIQINGNTVELEVSNSLLKKSSTYNNTQDKGIGLSNTKRRLALLYPDKHTFTVTKDLDKGLYIASLKIVLS